jgi:hypothetical protein
MGIEGGKIEQSRHGDAAAIAAEKLGPAGRPLAAPRSAANLLPRGPARVFAWAGVSYLSAIPRLLPLWQLRCSCRLCAARRALHGSCDRDSSRWSRAEAIARWRPDLLKSPDLSALLARDIEPIVGRALSPNWSLAVGTPSPTPRFQIPRSGSAVV